MRGYLFMPTQLSLLSINALLEKSYFRTQVLNALVESARS